MSQWTSEYAILRDLSLAQGRVPVAIEGTVGAGDKPPSLNITEETEEEFFKHCSADADVSAAPDLELIKKMLDMVRDIQVSSDEDYGSDKAVVISKLNPLSSEFVPKINNTSTPLHQSPKKEKKTKKPKKRQRNVAVESILQAIADNVTTKDTEAVPEPVKLLKPNDFITNNHVKENEMIGLTTPVQIDESQKTVINKHIQVTAATKHDRIKKSAPTVVEKVNGWFKTQTTSPFPKKVPQVMLEPTNMFKKKTVTEKIKKVESTVKSPTLSSNGEYKPSVLANEYYQKYVERSKFKESVKDDIWTRAEKKMKEIDAKRKRELTQTLTSPSSTSQGSENDVQSFEDTQSTDFLNMLNTTSVRLNHCLDIVSLPQHRHFLTGECIVCDVVNNFKVKELSVEKMEQIELENVTSDEKTEMPDEEPSISNDNDDCDDDDDAKSLSNEVTHKCQ